MHISIDIRAPLQKIVKVVINFIGTNFKNSQRQTTFIATGLGISVTFFSPRSIDRRFHWRVMATQKVYSLP